MPAEQKTVARPSPKMRRFIKLPLNLIGRLLKTGDPAATLDRLLTSQHVADLQLIVVVAFIIVFVIFVLDFFLSLADHSQGQSLNIQAVGAVIAGLLTLFTPVFVVFGAVLAWAYQVGSARLGVVDLFAGEISTLCRVMAVAETVKRFVDRFKSGPTAEVAGNGARGPSQQFVSQENYFPVFEGNTRDLQTLEARVVVNITAFYTYMKAVRDSMRTLAGIRPETADVGSPTTGDPVIGPWYEAARNVIYMLFLGLESARRAISDLVEFQPEKAERTIVILISELEAYRFLCDQFQKKDDIRHKRLMLRQPEYQRTVPPLINSVESSRASEMTGDGVISQWEEAYRLLEELRKRYDAAMHSIRAFENNSGEKPNFGG